MGNQSGRKKQKATAPVLCARHRGFDLWFEGIGWDLPRTDRMMKGRENGRYADICGDDIGAMEGLGWEFIAEPICFTATHGDAAVIASAWVAPMRTEKNEVGCNLTYAVDEAYEGRSLARLLTCLAFLAADQTHAGMTFANIESRTGNLASLALARSLTFTHYPDGDFTMPVAGAAEEAAFQCLRADMDALRHCAYRTLEERGLGALLSLIRGAARPAA